jgi:hypothetical protein
LSHGERPPANSLPPDLIRLSAELNRSAWVSFFGLLLDFGNGAATLMRNLPTALPTICGISTDMTDRPLMQGIEALMRKIWLLPGDAEEAEIEQYAANALECVRIGGGINRLELLLSEIQMNRLQQPSTKVATRELAEQAFALIQHPGQALH